MWERSHEFLLHSLIMDSQRRLQLIHAIALREGTTRELAERFSMPIPALKAFLEEHRDTIQHIAEEAEWEAQYEAAADEQAKAAEAQAEEYIPPSLVDPVTLDELWISKKSERLRRYQHVADLLYYAVTAQDQRGLTDATTLRELRSFMRYAAEELGQLLHRGSGDGSDGATVKYTLPGVDMDDLT